MRRKKILCMGDSLTEGYGISNAYAWPALLQDLLGIEVVNCGISGDTTGGMLARFDVALGQHQPSHAIIMGGTNDLWLDLPQNLILSNVMAMSRQARSADCQAVIGIPTSCFFDHDKSSKEDVFLSEEQLAVRVEHFQVYLRRAMEIDGLSIIDFSQHMNGDLFLPDGVHPNVKGNAVMAKTAFNEMSIHLAV